MRAVSSIGERFDARGSCRSAPNAFGLTAKSINNLRLTQ
jgi:hypothetical protein